MKNLPTIPVFAIAAGHEPAAESLRADPERLALLLASARKTYTPPGMRLADRLSRQWARHVVSPYNDAVCDVDATLGRPGAYLLNHSYEWGCTTGACEDPEQGGPTLMRVLDWPFDGLGRALVVTRHDGGAGPYDNLTWPGYVGVLTASAPGRFAAAINQPPLPAPWGKAVGWPLARYRVARSRAMPPSHLLRLAFDTCRTYDEAVELITKTPICIPAIYTLAGVKPGERITIERTENHALIAPRPAAANHWTAPGAPAGRPRNASSRARHAAMRALCDARPDWSLGWLHAPILDRDARVVMMANAASGKLVAQGFEKTGAATAALAL